MEFTCKEIGALLYAVSRVMMEQNVCAEAAMDGCTDERLIDIICVALDCEESKARELLQVSLCKAIEFNPEC